MLELIANCNTMDEVVLAPSFLIKELWEIDPTKGEISSNKDESSRYFGHFFGLALSNLFELAKDDAAEKWKQSLKPFITYLDEKFLLHDALKSHCTSNWNVSQD